MTPIDVLVFFAAVVAIMAPAVFCLWGRLGPASSKGATKMANHVQTPPGNGYNRVSPDQITLKEHFDEIVDAKLSRIEQMLEDRDKAMLVALSSIEKQIVELNASHERADSKLSDAYSRESHEVYAAIVSGEMDRMKIEEKIRDDAIYARILEIEKPKWTIWIAAAALMFTIVSGLGGTLWFLGITPYQNNLIRIEQQVEALLQHKDPPPTSPRPVLR